LPVGLIELIAAMRLSSILKHIMQLPQKADVEFIRLQLDSRKAAAGDVFVALKGTQVDGRQFISEVISRGTVAVLAESETNDAAVDFQNDIPVISIPKLRNALGEIAAAYYGYPAREMKIYGVTGTNGKTSITHFLAQALQHLAVPCGVIGTLGNGIYGSLGEPGLTTPDAVTLQAMLREFANNGANAAAMEVSSHSIDQGRINGIEFEAGIFTNLTQDHLDYHGTMEAYAAVKKRLFTDFPIKHIIINSDDTVGRKWLEEIKHPSRFAYGLHHAQLPASIPQIFADKISLSLSGIHCTLSTPWGDGDLSLPLIGQFNLCNVMAVLAVLCLQGFSFQDVLNVLMKLSAVPGRMQLLGGRGRPLVAVDYSHTPDSLEKALQSLRKHTGGKLICVFGCGGNRDIAKRPLMAGIAEQWSDQVIVTNDNPRHEDPEEIARQIIKGFQFPERVDIILDRSKAIEKSIQCATANDCILIAGKGAEQYQQIGDQKYPFDDVKQVNRYLNETVKEHHGDS